MSRALSYRFGPAPRALVGAAFAVAALGGCSTLQGIQGGIQSVKGEADKAKQEAEKGQDEADKARGIKKDGSGGSGSNEDDDRLHAADSPINEPLNDKVDFKKGDKFDWRKVQLGGKPGIATFEVHWDDENANLDIDVYDKFGTNIGKSPPRLEGQTVKRVLVQITEPGIYYVRIAAPTIKDTSIYTAYIRWKGPGGPVAGGGHDPAGAGGGSGQGGPQGGNGQGGPQGGNGQGGAQGGYGGPQGGGQGMAGGPNGQGGGPQQGGRGGGPQGGGYGGGPQGGGYGGGPQGGGYGGGPQGGGYGGPQGGYGGPQGGYGGPQGGYGYGGPGPGYGYPQGGMVYPPTPTGPPAIPYANDPTKLLGAIVSAYKEGSRWVLYLDRGSQNKVRVGMSGFILEGAEGDKVIEGASFTVAKVLDERKAVAYSGFTKPTLGKNRRVVLNLK